MLTKELTTWLAPWLLQAVVMVTGLATLGGAAFLLIRPDWSQSHPFLHALCNVTPVWLLLRSIGFAIGLMVVFEVGPEVLRGEQTGATVFRDIGINSLVILSIACQLMPFLTEFGFMEFVGTLLRAPFEKLFRLPGRSAIDATASFLSAAAVGLLITIGQYERGYYSVRESAAVATNFSVVSLPFSLLIAQVAGIGHLYFNWYLTMIIACLVCAFIMVRIPPLSRMPDSFHPGSVGAEAPAGADGAAVGLFAQAVTAAAARAETAPNASELVRGSLLQTVSVTFNVIPASMALATLTAVLVFHTPVFEWLALPIAWMLELCRFPEASATAPGLLVGFLDQFMPALVAVSIDSELARFVLAGLSVTQLIFMAEVGVLILPFFSAARDHGSAADLHVADTDCLSFADHCRFTVDRMMKPVLILIVDWLACADECLQRSAAGRCARTAGATAGGKSCRSFAAADGCHRPARIQPAVDTGDSCRHRSGQAAQSAGSVP